MQICYRMKFLLSRLKPLYFVATELIDIGPDAEFNLCFYSFTYYLIRLLPGNYYTQLGITGCHQYMIEYIDTENMKMFKISASMDDGKWVN